MPPESPLAPAVRSEAPATYAVPRTASPLPSETLLARIERGGPAALEDHEVLGLLGVDVDAATLAAAGGLARTARRPRRPAPDRPPAGRGSGAGACRARAARALDGGPASPRRRAHLARPHRTPDDRGTHPCSPRVRRGMTKHPCAAITAPPRFPTLACQAPNCCRARPRPRWRRRHRGHDEPARGPRPSDPPSRYTVSGASGPPFYR